MSGPSTTVMDILAWLRATVPSALDGAHHLQLDSRRVAPGDVFVGVPGAVPGRSADGRAYVRAAAALGAAAALVEAEGWTPVGVAIPVLPVPGLRRLVGALAASFYGRPSEKLLAIGVTGTNGKTSCTQWIAQLLTFEGMRCGVIGTIGSGFPGAAFAGAALTTPDASALQRQLRALLDDGARAVALEVSSIGLDQGRVDGMAFDIALFTNLTRDHLDYHGTLENYEAAKARLIDWPTLSHAVLNLDDAAGERFAARLAQRSGVRVIGFTTQAAAAPAPLALRLSAHAVRATATGLRFEVDDGVHRIDVAAPLVGAFNVSNLLGVLGVAVAAGIPLARACAVVPRLAPPPGRMQRIGADGAPLAIVDYAHTPDALAQALVALAPLAQARGGRLWIVFGAGGDRDPGKRAPMGEAAARLADRVVITSDNPRTEPPEAIVEAIARGIPADRATRVERIVDRAEAIAYALGAADAADVVLIAGKGHEDYQEIGGVKRPFSDAEHARAALARRGASAATTVGATAGPRTATGAAA
jgi:UDP-N-acetylmuramoyl-L-alanyl-D-glutamate--2,6-diaminopimelate ligase